jgi:hypothetical protein
MWRIRYKDCQEKDVTSKLMQNILITLIKINVFKPYEHWRSSSMNTRNSLWNVLDGENKTELTLRTPLFIYDSLTRRVDDLWVLRRVRFVNKEFRVYSISFCLALCFECEPGKFEFFYLKWVFFLYFWIVLIADNKSKF